MTTASLLKTADKTLEHIVSRIKSGTSIWLKGWGMSQKEKILAGKRIGIYIDPILNRFFLRYVISVLAGVFVALGITLIDVLLSLVLHFHFMNFWSGAVITLAVFAYVVQNDKVPMLVPIAHGAMLTVAGMRVRIYLTEGDHPWTGERMLIGRSKKVSEPGTDKDGFVFLGEMQIAIWNESTDTKRDAHGNSVGNIVLKNVAKDSSDITANLLLVIRLLDPMRWLNSSDALLDVADRARAALRTAIAFFIGTDNTGVKSVLGALMSGATILTCFIGKTVGPHAAGAMLRDTGGTPMYLTVELNDSGNDTFAKALSRAKTAFQKEIAQHGNPDMLKEITYQKKTKRGSSIPIDVPVLEDRTVKDALGPAVTAVGAHVLRATIAHITLSPEVSEQANKASSEPFQLDAQVNSAKAIKASRDALKPSAAEMSEPGYELSLFIAAEKDAKHPGSYKFVHVGGPQGNNIPSALVAGLSQGTGT